ncbi:MAG: DNA polymerase III subunit alpha, partial [Alphaproteobacteria bacterium]|nr:DNA polymerase III subunit alpha [Alphaproteobacteria bacterium]
MHDKGPGFVHLRVRSAYSLLEGALPINLLAKLALADKQPALAICDNGNLFGAFEFCTKLSHEGIQPIIGMMLSVRMDDEEESFVEHRQQTIAFPSIALFVQNSEGYRNLIRLSSESFMEMKERETRLPYVSLKSLEEYSSGLIALTGGSDGPIDRALYNKNYKSARLYLEKLHSFYGNRLYLELQRHDLKKELECEPLLLEMAYETGIPLAATNDVFFPEQKDFEAHKALLCIAEGKILSDDDGRVSPEHYFKSREKICTLFKDLPEATANTVEIASRCSFFLEPSSPVLPNFFKNNLDENEELGIRAEKGLTGRLEMHDLAPGADKKKYLDRLKSELTIIERMRYSGYFLIVADFVGWAKKQSIPVGPGRGSGAGSLVAWSLGITELDPLRFGLLFERFLNPERVSMPDFDIDFCQNRRDEVISYVQERYGEERVAQIITFGTLQARAVLRDVGRVLAIPYREVDALCKLVPNNPANPVSLQQALKEEVDLRQACKFKPEIGKLLSIAQSLEGLYRHASTHAAGLVICRTALNDVVPLYRDQKSSLPMTQFNMKWVEQAGLVKFDFLGLKTLSIIKKTVDLLKNRSITLDMGILPLDDAKTYELFSSGETIGVFQVESSGMRDELKRMRPDRFEDIIA